MGVFVKPLALEYEGRLLADSSPLSDWKSSLVNNR
jgi:hypothetical protein